MEEFSKLGVYKGTGILEDYLYIKYLDVGDGDCIFIKLPSGETVLIDTGDPDHSNIVLSFLEEQNLCIENGQKKIDYIIITHGHSDHIGGLTNILKNYSVEKIYMPEIAGMKDWHSDIEETEGNLEAIELLRNDYNIYMDAINYMDEHGIELINTVRGEYIDSNNILKFVQSDKDYGPIGSQELVADYWGMNENSAVVLLEYEELTALFTGDIEWNSEEDFYVNDLLDSKKIDVLKVPHHGLDTSSTGFFLKYLKPTFGVISRSESSIDYNDAYKRLLERNIVLYETSENNGVSVYATKDGWNIEN